ncbi:UDP-galactopyranose mutase [Seminavis robusta]|uniref:UDP-galactopyranose mutase n=1 Tax=Seminavis robusta TaxID=568900 RepID=A0A9N8DTX2_9STRA|nr:UDP-galactopyranose mutase [Seminavis robusta]|eukprot:Sro368_g127980.1 UDP-galactopyranose mutase (1143) ;mRNA; f:37224-40746
MVKTQQKNGSSPQGGVGGGGRSIPTCFMSMVIVILLLGQLFLYRNCQQQVGSALLESYTASFSQLAASVGLSSSTGSGSSPGEGGILAGHYDVCIAGAGLSGAVLAERYASQLGHKVLVVEKRAHIGGNCFDYIDKDTGVRVSQYGAHLFHTYFDDVWDYVQKFGPWTPYEHKVRGIVNGKDVPIPVNIETVNILFDLNIQSQEEMDEWLKKEQIPNDNPQNSEEVALSRVGKRLYELIFKPYTFKQWNKYPVELGPEVLQRIPVRNNWDERYFSDPHQALPTNGYTSLFENMFKSQHITVLTNTDYFQIRDKVSCGKHYFSGPIDAYFAEQKLPKLEYRSLEFERKVEENTQFFQQAFVVNHPQDNDDYTRIVEYKHLYNQSHLPHTVYFIERSKDGGEPYYPVPNKRNKDLFKQYQNLAKKEEKTKNVSFVGRLANYKYFNMDQAINNALELFTKDTGIAYTMSSLPVKSEIKAVEPQNQAMERLQFSPAVPADQRLYPDWRQAVDCSAWDNMCASLKQLENKYKDYPFPLGRKVKNKNLFKFKPLGEIPEDWKPSLHVNNSLDLPPPRKIEYIYPTEVPLTEKEKCMENAKSSTWQEQVRQLLESRLKREEVTNMVAFTISDYNYAFDMIHDIFEMNDNVVGFENAFFMVVLDQETLELCCRYGYPVVAWPSVKPESSEELKHAVANTKFEVSLELVKLEYDFFFYEMDVWFVKSPKAVIKEYHKDPEHDFLVSSHQNCPMCMNIGVYSVTANENTKEYFELNILMAKESPGTHDQWIMGQLQHLADQYRAGQKPMKFEGRWFPPPETNPPPMNYPVRAGFYSAQEIVANERPVPTQQTYAIHTLAGGPLKKPHGKKIMAKELGAWYGFDGPNGDGGYYRRTGERRRYLWMDGHMPNTYNTVQNWEWAGWESGLFHDVGSVKYTMATLLALARRTGRIFVMPKIHADHGVHYLWTILDFETVEEMGIDYRETNFPHNPKSWHREGEPFQSVARTALGSIKDSGQERTMYVQYPNKATVFGGDDATEGKVKAWKFERDIEESTALDAWWALHTAIRKVDSAELLLVNPHYITGNYARRMEILRKTPGAKMSVAEKEIMEVYSRLRWCFDHALPVVIYENIVGRSSSEYDCHGKGKPIEEL